MKHSQEDKILHSSDTKSFMLGTVEILTVNLNWALITDPQNKLVRSEGAGAFRPSHWWKEVASFQTEVNVNVNGCHFG